MAQHATLTYVVPVTSQSLKSEQEKTGNGNFNLFEPQTQTQTQTSTNLNPNPQASPASFYLLPTITLTIYLLQSASKTHLLSTRFLNKMSADGPREVYVTPDTIVRVVPADSDHNQNQGESQDQGESQSQSESQNAPTANGNHFKDIMVNSKVCWALSFLICVRTASANAPSDSVPTPPLFSLTSCQTPLQPSIPSKTTLSRRAQRRL